MRVSLKLVIQEITMFGLKIDSSYLQIMVLSKNNIQKEEYLLGLLLSMRVQGLQLSLKINKFNSNNYCKILNNFINHVGEKQLQDMLFQQGHARCHMLFYRKNKRVLCQQVIFFYKFEISFLRMKLRNIYILLKQVYPSYKIKIQNSFNGKQKELTLSQQRKYFQNK
ncbi:hypothetical protein ABPG74_020100 [Tetrahymena malaccensis]